MPLDMSKIENSKKLLTPNQIEALNLYINEANFMYTLIKEDIDGAPKTIYEIGSGIGLLSRMVAELGHRVIATEPSTNGFEIVKTLQHVIQNCYTSDSNSPEFYDMTAENLYDFLVKKDLNFDYIFCANVIEHVPKLPDFFASTLPLKSQKGSFRIICPNYSIPYEPHFGFITLFSKKLTYIFQRKKIYKKNMESDEDLITFYHELSFPTIKKLNMIFRKYSFKIIYNRSATNHYIQRAVEDEFFAERKKVISFIVKFFKIPILSLVQFLPKQLLPVIDCVIK
jgi:2-polyprenyl-3-methyl-5-hydroxy-6-metoxy-1,4-benzoquinol methylase